MHGSCSGMGRSPLRFGAVNIACALPPAPASNKPGVLDVTVCSAESLLVTVVCAPGGTVIGLMQWKPSIVIWVAATGAAVAGGPGGTGAGDVAVAYSWVISTLLSEWIPRPRSASRMPSRARPQDISPLGTIDAAIIRIRPVR